MAVVQHRRAGSFLCHIREEKGILTEYKISSAKKSANHEGDKTYELVWKVNEMRYPDEFSVVIASLIFGNPRSIRKERRELTLQTAHVSIAHEFVQRDDRGQPFCYTSTANFLQKGDQLRVRIRYFSMSCKRVVLDNGLIDCVRFQQLLFDILAD